ncbi:MAG TPA: LUD domain-containing protein [Acidobacteriaceae bacterium]|nr:LUD domain-containing protein [Acidobacteriaceae bacterium]
MNDAIARTEILARIRSANAAHQTTCAADAWQAIPREYRQQGERDRVDCISLLEDRLRDYGAGVYRSARGQISVAIAGILRQRNCRRVLVPAELDRDWLPQQFTFVTDSGLSHGELDACDGVLTGCSLAIAMTGTLVLSRADGLSPEQRAGRRALTLVPDYHLCIVESSSVVETVPQAFHALEPLKHQPITFISGPSATADIEMTRIQGVHGPRVLDVLLVD